MMTTKSRHAMIAALAGLLLAAPAASGTPSLSFTDASGRALDFARFRGRPVLVEIWASWCAPCMPRLAALDRLARKESSISIVPISVDRGGPVAAHRAFVRAKIRSLPLYVADPEAVRATFGRLEVPTILLLDADGRLVLRQAGDRIDDNIVERAVARLLATQTEKAER